MQLLYFKKIVALVSICALVLLLYTRNHMSSVERQNVLRMGIAAGYAPFISINAQGEYEGFDIDVARHVAALLQQELVFKDLGSMTSLLMALDQGAVDAAIWGISITQARLKKFAMINYQGRLTAAYVLLFWGKIPAGVTTMHDMQGRVVCVEPSSAQHAVLNKYPDITMLLTEKVDDALLNIQYGKADAAFVEPAIAKKFKAKFSEIQSIDIPLDADDQVQGIGIVVNKSNDQLAQRIAAAVETLKQQGVIAELENKWGIE